MKLENKYCVISPNLSYCNRTWLPTTNDGIEHAKKILRGEVGHSKVPPDKTFYVVEVVAVVRPRSDFEVLNVDES